MQEKEDLQTYLADAPVFVRRDNGEIIMWTAGASRLYGYSQENALGRISHELLCTEFPETLDAINGQLRAAGAWQGLLRHCHADGHRLAVKSAWKRTVSAARRQPVVIETNIDVSDRLAAEHRQALLAAELKHRVKNTITVVQSLAHMSFAGVPREVVAPFEGRLMALARAQDLLLQTAWEGADLMSVIGRVVDIFQACDRVRLHGPSASISPAIAVAYSLAFHGLCTNAMKYGALSNAEGRIEVTWTLSGFDQSRIHLIWRERDGPPVTPPSREGFGTRLLKRALAMELGAPVRLQYLPNGLVCEFDGSAQTAPEPDWLSPVGAVS